MRRSGAALVVLIAAAPACSPFCKAMRANREAFLARTAAVSSPHATIHIPFAVANRLLAPRAARLAPIDVPALPGIGKLLGPLRVVPREVTLGPARPGRVGVRIAVDVESGGRPVLSAIIGAEPRPAIDVGRRRIEVALRPGDVVSIEPSLGPDALDRMTATIRSRVPGGAALPEREVRRLARSATDLLGKKAGSALVASGLLSRVGEISRLSLELPAVPIARLDLRSSGDRDRGGILVDVFTSLPVGPGLSPERDPDRYRSDGIRVRIAAATAVELGNWALAAGLLPARYDQDMKPREDGDYTPGLRWVPGPRPLKLYAWRLRRPCFRARIGARPRLELSGGKLIAGIEDGELEEVRGAPLVQARVWMKRIGADVIRFTRTKVASARISLGGVPVRGVLTRASYAGGAIDLSIAVEPAPVPR